MKNLSAWLLIGCCAVPLWGQADAKSIVARAVDTELRADRDDHTAYVYRDRDVTPDHDTLYQVVETPKGDLKLKLEDHGHPLSSAQKVSEDIRLQALLQDSSLRQRQQKDEAHDDEEAAQMLKLLPEAFLWTVKAETAASITLSFKPNPHYDAKNMEARVLGAMAGEIVVDRLQNRIVSLRGTLVQDVKIAYGILGRLKQGGTFQVERREVAPHHWQVTESRVHIDGHVLFKTIGSQEDELKTDFRVSNAQTLRQAYDLLEPSHK